MMPTNLILEFEISGFVLSSGFPDLIFLRTYTAATASVARSPPWSPFRPLPPSLGRPRSPVRPQTQIQLAAAAAAHKNRNITQQQHTTKHTSRANTPAATAATIAQRSRRLSAYNAAPNRAGVYRSPSTTNTNSGCCSSTSNTRAEQTKEQPQHNAHAAHRRSEPGWDFASIWCGLDWAWLPASL